MVSIGHEQATREGRVVLLAAQNDEQAFAQQVRECEQTLFAAAMAITKNRSDAEDCVQEAIFQGWRKLDTLKEPRYFKTWLTRIVVTTAINSNRKRKPSLPLLVEMPGPRGNEELSMDIRAAIEGLDEKTRLVTVLYYFEDMPLDEIAKATGLFPGTIKSRLHRARAKLREVLKGYEHDE